MDTDDSMGEQGSLNRPEKHTVLVQDANVDQLAEPIASTSQIPATSSGRHCWSQKRLCSLSWISYISCTGTGMPDAVVEIVLDLKYKWSGTTVR